MNLGQRVTESIEFDSAVIGQSRMNDPVDVTDLDPVLLPSLPRHKGCQRRDRIGSSTRPVIAVSSVGPVDVLGSGP